MNIVAGIVLFNPDVNRFNICFVDILNQFDEVIIFDNVGNFREYLCQYDKVVYISENENKGVAYALNRIMDLAKEKGYEWVVTLDQDTKLPHNLVSEYLKYTDIPDVAILSPQVIDPRRPYLKEEKSSQQIKYIEDCITSASCTNIKIWTAMGGFDEWLFIDFVDNEYCKRVVAKGYKILKLMNVVVNQEFGNISIKSAWKVKFFLWLSRITHNVNIAKLTYNKIVNPIRIYYVHRNLLYLNKKLSNIGGIGYSNFNCNSFCGFLFYITINSKIKT